MAKLLDHNKGPMSNTERARLFRERKRQNQEAEVRGVFAPVERHEEIKKLVTAHLSKQAAPA